MEKKSVKEIYLQVKEHLKANPNHTVNSTLKKFGLSPGSYYNYCSKDRKEVHPLKNKTKNKKDKVTALVPHTIEYVKPERMSPVHKSGRAMLVIGYPEDLAAIVNEFLKRG